MQKNYATAFRNGWVWLMLMICWGFPKHAQATHIVGGELEITRLNGNLYRLALIMYFDDVNGQPGAKDDFVDISVFRKRDNRLVNNYVLPLRTDAFVSYTNPACAVGSLRTRRLYYSLDIILSASIFNDAEGYYFVHERCCRNQGIVNIVRPEDAAQTFYLEFPAVSIDGQPFINSSPRLFPPLSDYGCINQPFYFDFSGTDLDGDSLAYFIDDPLNGFSTPNNPKPRVMAPGPYPDVQFRPGYSVNYMIDGRPTLSINPKTGFLTITPTRLGLFVFSIRCDEFRNGQKIGSVVRDFQMMVLDCPVARPPKVEAVLPNGTRYNPRDTLRYVIGVEDNCFELKITDPDVNTILQARIVPINFPTNELEVVATPTQSRLQPGDTAVYKICLKKCPTNFDTTFQAMLLVGDNSCALPLFDTINVIIDLRQPNQPPTIEAEDLVFLSDSNFYEVNIELGDTVRFDVVGTDPDNDPVILRAFGQGVTLQQLGMRFLTGSGMGRVQSEFSWTPNCEAFPPNQNNVSYKVDFTVGDIGPCGIKDTDTVTVKFNIFYVPEPNTPPNTEVLETFYHPETLTYIDTLYLGDTLDLTILSTDPELDSLLFSLIPQGFSLAAEGFVLTSEEGEGEIRSRLQWVTSCDNLPNVLRGESERVFEFEAQTQDWNACNQVTTRTVKLRLVLIFKPDPSKRPTVLVPEATFNADSNYYEYSVRAGKPINLNILAQDEQGDQLTLFVRSLGFDWEEIGIDVLAVSQGTSPLQTALGWNTSCDLLTEYPTGEFMLQLVVQNQQACGIEAYDTVALKLIITDEPAPAPEDFPNAFTPNGDGLSEGYRVSQLPDDTCQDSFEYVEIVNRWGDQVFRSEERDFVWNGDGFTAGVYYYYIHFTKTTYKGSLHLVKQ